MDGKITFIKKIIFFYFVILYSAISLAQNCNDYGTNCGLINKSYAKGSISQGLKILSGQVISMVCVFYEGMENCISVCGEFETGEINFQILNYDTREQLYDNSDDHNRQNISLNVEVTTKVIIHLSAPNAKYSFSEGKCIGLLVAYKTLENKILK